MTEQVVFKNAKFITADDFSLPYKSAAELNRLFSLDFIKKNAAALSFKGGRGQTALFSLSGEDLVLRQYLRGGLWGTRCQIEMALATSIISRSMVLCIESATLTS